MNTYLLNENPRIRLVEAKVCPACQSTSGISFLLALNQTRLYRCSCGIRFIDPSLDLESQIAIYQSSDTIKLIHPEHEQYYEYDCRNKSSQTYQHYTRTLNEAKALLPPVQGEPRLLEVGCGAGVFLKVAREQGWSAAGIDSSKSNMDNLKREGFEVFCEDFSKFQAPHKFDAVVMWDILEHPQDPNLFVMKAYELLNPGGLLIVVGPCYPNFLSSIAESMYKFSIGLLKGPVNRLYFLDHTSYFSPEGLSSLLKKHGFDVIRSWKVNTDVDRYKFKPHTRILLRTLFVCAQALNLQNRLHIIARK